MFYLLLPTFHNQILCAPLCQVGVHEQKEEEYDVHHVRTGDSDHDIIAQRRWTLMKAHID